MSGGQGGGRPMQQGAGLMGQPGFNRNAIGSPGMSTFGGGMDGGGGPPPVVGGGGGGMDGGGSPYGAYEVDMARPGAGAPAGTNYNVQASGARPAFSADYNMGGAGPQMDPHAAAAGYTSIMGPGGQGYRGVAPGREGFAANRVAQAQQRMASQPHMQEAGGMAPGNAWLSQIGKGAPPGYVNPTGAGGTSWGQIGQMTNNFGNGSAPNGGYFAPDGTHTQQGINPATGRPFGQ